MQIYEKIEHKSVKMERSQGLESNAVEGSDKRRCQLEKKKDLLREEKLKFT